jgi:pilus assembly protein TadC
MEMIFSFLAIAVLPSLLLERSMSSNSSAMLPSFPVSLEDLSISSNAFLTISFALSLFSRHSLYTALNNKLGLTTKPLAFLRSSSHFFAS